MPVNPESPESHDDEPVLILQGGTDRLQLHEGGKVYVPGDRLPKNLGQQQRVSLQAAGVRFEWRYPEPVLTPDGEPATMAAAEQIDPEPGAGPVVIAAVEDVPKDRPTDPSAHAPRRAARKDAD
jgi:hypothetical protein